MDHTKNIETECVALNACRDELAAEMEVMNAAIEAVKARHRPAIRRLVRKLKTRRDMVMGEVSAHPELFAKPKSRIFDGVKVGFRKQPGKLEITDQATSIKLLRRHLGADAEALIKTSEALIKSALVNQPAQVLKKAAITVTEDSDVCFVSFVDRDIDKIIDALLAEEGAEDGEL